MMNSIDWEASVRKWKTTMNSPQKTERDRMENPSGTLGTRHTSCHHRADAVHDPRTRLLPVQSGQCPSTNSFYVEKAELFVQDGKLFDTDPEDQDLTRKLKHLRELEERTMCRKASPACKPVSEPSLGAPGEHSCRRTGTSLKERVDAILQQRQSNGFLSQRHCRSRIKSTGPSKGDEQEEDHPLKTRVNVLMKHRRRRPCASPSITQPPPHPPRAEENGVDQGFQRFLNVLNKGVDVDLLRRIVNDDSEDLCLDDKLHNIQRREATDLSFRERRYSKDGNSLGEPGGRGERSTDPRSQERSHSNPIPGHDESKEEALSPCSFRTLSHSPSAVRNNKDDEEKTKHDQQHEHLQNILKSLGLQLETEEMSQLANRTQERLYGKKTDNAVAQSRRKPDRQPKRSPRSNRGSSSSSCSCSSRSSSRSRSSSSSSCGSSRGNVSGGRSDGSRARSGENQAGQENREKRLEASSEEQQQSYAQPHAWPPPNPCYSLTPLPDYTQYSQYSSYCDALGSYWTYSQGPMQPSFYPSSHPYAPNQCQNFPGTLLEHPRGFPGRGQTAPALGQRRLPTPHGNKAWQTGKKYRGRKRKWRKRTKKSERKREKEAQATVAGDSQEEESAVDQQPAPEEVAHVPQSHNGASLGHNSKAKKSKQRLSEEEIKANLRKTLEAFNRKAKQAVIQPVSLLPSQADEDLVMKL